MHESVIRQPVTVIRTRQGSYVSILAITKHPLAVMLNMARLFLAFYTVFGNWYSVIPRFAVSGNGKVVVRLRGGDALLTMSIGAIRTIVERMFYHLDVHVQYHQGVFTVNGVAADPMDSESITEALLISKGWVRLCDTYLKGDLSFRGASPFALLEVFEDKPYDFGVISGDVLDIGGSVGDTAVFFALRGASKVVAYEPLPAVYQLGVANVQLNKLSDKVAFVNAAIGAKRSQIRVPGKLSGESSRGYSTRSKKWLDEQSVAVEVLPFSEAAEALSRPCLLKLDCEGCEEEVLMSQLDAVLRFRYVVFEYHEWATRSDLARMLRKLKPHYDCKVEWSPLCTLAIVRCVRLRN